MKNATVLASRSICRFMARRHLHSGMPLQARPRKQKEPPSIEKPDPVASAPKRRKVKATKADDGVSNTSTSVKTGAGPSDDANLPLPWTGRLGYACLNTYLRSAQPSVFCSRTCRIASIMEHRHPLQDPSIPEHATKNRPDKTKTPDVRLGQLYLEKLGKRNARDLSTLLRWNERFGIRFLRISSDMFPFASHAEYGYGLEFAAEELAAAGRIAARFGHRLTMHPGQYTQLGSPKDFVIEGAIRDLAYHSDLLKRLQLPPALDRDAVMIIHMGGVFGDKAATLDRFSHVFKNRLTPDMRARLVLENDDISWSVADLLPLCEELGIPLVLDYHHHRIVGGETDIGLASVAANTPLAARIRATWSARGITPKYHYSEPYSKTERAPARDRRKHSARPAHLPPCPADADLMIEAKDKEQAVFALMRKYKLPGYERIGNVVPYERTDEGEGVDPDEANMGGPEGRVFWSMGRGDWLKRKSKGRKKALEKLKAAEKLKKA